MESRHLSESETFGRTLGKESGYGCVQILRRLLDCVSAIDSIGDIHQRPCP